MSGRPLALSLPGVSALLAAVGGMGWANVVQAAPPNDTCANAQVITVAALNTPQTVTGTNVAATSDLAESGCSVDDNRDVWYALTVSIAATYTFDTVDSLLDDTSLAIYSGCGGVQLACNDDISTADAIYWSRISIVLSAGQSILVRVAGYEGATGAFNLNVVATAPIANDECSAPEPISVDQVKTGANFGADTSVGLDATACGTFLGSGGGADVFYSFTPPATGQYTLSLCGSSFDTVLAVLTDCSGQPSSIVACNDDSDACGTGSFNSQITNVSLTAGTAYLVRVAGYDDGLGGAVGNFSLVIHSNTPPPTGVCCRGAGCATGLTQGACVAGGLAGASFVSSAAACNAGGSTIAPCCYADYNKVNDITVQDIFDYLGDWFAGSSFAIVGGDGSSGTLSVQAIFDYLNAWFAGGC